MGSLFRSRDMVMCQLILQSESAYDILSLLGDAAVLHFRDVSDGDSQFRRVFVNEIYACSEMERILDVLSEQVKHLNISPYFIQVDTPPPREYITLLESLAQLEVDLLKATESQTNLERRKVVLQRQHDVLQQGELFLEAAHIALPSGSRNAEIGEASHEPLAVEKETKESGKQLISESLRLSIICGTMAPRKVPSFEQMIWRLSRGNAYFRHNSENNCFLMVVQGGQLKEKTEKICNAYHAKLYDFITDHQRRHEAMEKIKTELSDMTSVIEETKEHNHRILSDIGRQLPAWKSRVCKIKSIFYTMNLFNLNISDRCLVGECWCPTDEQTIARDAMKHGTELAHSDKPSLLITIPTGEMPPTYNKLNKFTSPFQEIVNAYGVASYKEVNPAVFAIITFPFLFAIMFGDVGHGCVMTFLALFLIIKEKWLISIDFHRGELLGMIFGGRYIIVLMGIFSIYTGFVYNDVFGRSLNIYGSRWNAHNLTEVSDVVKGRTSGPELLASLKEIQVDLDPNQGAYTAWSAYPFGLDPIWGLTEKRIIFTNSFKMKMSIVFAVIYMSFGIVLSCFNHVYNKDYVSVLLEFIPRILFLHCIFGYLVRLIFYKWFAFTVTMSACAPSLLPVLINMFMVVMSKMPDNPTNLDGTVCATSKFYPYQEQVQLALLIVAIICLPIMLMGRPLVNLYRLNRKVTHEPTAAEVAHGGGHGKHQTFGDVMVHQCIHTIEYCLGIISNTASFLRLWALSLAHSQLADVLWTQVMHSAMTVGQSSNTPGWRGVPVIFCIFAAWAVLSLSILVLMEGMSAFLHTLRLHWVEFQNKFYKGEGFLYEPFSFKRVLEL